MSVGAEEGGVVVEEGEDLFVMGAGGLMMDLGSPQIYKAAGPAAVVAEEVNGVGGGLTQGNLPCLLPPRRKLGFKFTV